MHFWRNALHHPACWGNFPPNPKPQARSRYRGIRFKPAVGGLLCDLCCCVSGIKRFHQRVCSCACSTRLGPTRIVSAFCFTIFQRIISSRAGLIPPHSFLRSAASVAYSRWSESIGGNFFNPRLLKYSFAALCLSMAVSCSA